MPVKQRTKKALPFEDHHCQQLLEGPNACLLAGVGYLAHISTPTLGTASPEEEAAILEAMRADWLRHGPEMMGRWRRREQEPTVRPWVFPYLGGPDSLPWAAQEFGELADSKPGADMRRP